MSQLDQLLNQLAEYAEPVRYQTAHYIDPQISIYRGNPLIEALPPILSVDKFVELIQRKPHYDPDDRNAPVEVRLHTVGQAKSFFEPLSIHIRLEQKISRLIRQGYEGRNPANTQFWQDSDERLDELERSLDDTQLHQPSGINQRNSTLGMGFIGFSGMGKSTSLAEILMRGYPQVIKHTEYKGHAFSRHQVTWMQVDCPHDGSINQLCNFILESFDQLLGINSYKVFGRGGRATANELSLGISRLAQAYNLGVLVIDEIQRLSYVKRNREMMMSFLVQLINTIGVPVLFVGTPDARELLMTKLSLARRAAGQGDCMWNPLPNDEEWYDFIEVLWTYQYTNPPTPLTKKLVNCLHDQSQGIIDIAIKIYMLTQIAAMEMGMFDGGDETITCSFIESVAKRELANLQLMIEALREKDARKLALFDDTALLMLDTVVDDAITDALKKKG